MYPFGRLFISILKSSRAKPAGIDDICEINFRCMPWDLDLFMEMNNGRVLTLYDLGRFDFSIRSGLGKLLKTNNWGLVVAGSTIRYRKRVRMFDKVSMHTKMMGHDERWIYIEQSMWVAGEPASSVLLLRTAITRHGKMIPSQTVLDAMGIPDWQSEPSLWLQEWVNSEEHRPWPPQI